MITTIYPRSKEEVDREILQLRKTMRKILKTKASARRFFIEGGFITKSGKFTKQYRS